MRQWIDIVENAFWVPNEHGRTPTQEYEGQNAFIQKMRSNPRVLARHVSALKKLRDDFTRAYEDVGADHIHRASLDILGNYPHSDISVEEVEDRIGHPDWDECDANPEAAAEFALKILDDAVAHPIDWDCIAGLAMRHLLGRSSLLRV